MHTVLHRSLKLGTGVVLGAAVLFVLIAARPKPKTKPSRDTRAVVEVTTAKLESHQAMVTGYGTVGPAERLRLVAEVEGRIVETGPGLKTGAFLRTGDLIVRIDDTTLRAELARLKAQLAGTNAKIVELAEQHHADRSLLETEQRSYELAKADTERETELRDKGLSPESAVGASVTKTNDRLLVLQRRRAAIATYDAQVAGLKASRDSILASIDPVSYLVGQTTLRAPFNCRVEEVNASLYGFARRGEQLASLYPIDAPFEVSVPLRKKDLRSLYDIERLDRDAPPWKQKRLSATVHWEGPNGNHSTTATVDRVKAWVDPVARTPEVVLQLDSPAARARKGTPRGLIPGTFVRVEITGRVFEDVIVLPHIALTVDDTVYVVVDEKLIEVSVSPVASTADAVLVSPEGALQAGSTIVLNEVEGAFEGLPVRVSAAGQSVRGDR